MGFSRQEYRNGFPFPPPGNVPHPGNKPVSPVSCISRQILYQWATWEAKCFLCLYWVDIMISSLFLMSVLSYFSWFFLYETNFVFLEHNQLCYNVLCSFLYTDESISQCFKILVEHDTRNSKIFFTKSKGLIMVKSMIWFRQGCAELLRVPGGFWPQKQTLEAAAVLCHLVAVINFDYI